MADLADVILGWVDFHLGPVQAEELPGAPDVTILRRLSRFPARLLLEPRPATISARRWPIPGFKSSLLASTITIAGASIANCSGERLNRKSQCRSAPRRGSSEKSAPEKRPRDDPIDGGPPAAWAMSRR